MNWSFSLRQGLQLDFIMSYLENKDFNVTSVLSGINL